MKRTVLIGAMVLGFILVANIVFGNFYVIPTRPLIAGTEIKSLPYTIPSSGFYFITRDLTSTGNGIVVIETSNVTIDLMGFSLIGPGKGTGIGNGIDMHYCVNVEVRNGTVRDFGVDGIREDSNEYGRNHRIIGVKANKNGGSGIGLNCSGNLIKDCTSANNTAYGIWSGFGSTVIGNTVHSNQLKGIYAGDGCTVKDNTAYYNQYEGIYAIEGCTVTDNTASNNQTTGIYAGNGCTVKGNTAYKNQQYGIYLNGNCLVHGNTCYDNNQCGGAYTNISACIPCTYGTNHAP